MDSKGRIVISKIVREELGLGEGAWGVMEVYGKNEGKILLIITDKGKPAKEK
jgi:bifunctional DNA-binding transcriptional regulator/antitoxin component of YhaV-PrlF toxin-antitoxin module